jgi:8-oxo-dGTP pyrophosphatase MutT (NUDIX family)
MIDVRALSRLTLNARSPEQRDPAAEDGEGKTEAAVMLLLYERDGREHILFQERTQHVQHHKGEISLPGGRRDAGDGTLLDTALRETDEEIGVTAADIEVFGSLDLVVTTLSNYAISPFAGAITADGEYAFKMAEREVKELLIVPVDHLMDTAHVEWTVRELGGVTSDERVFHFGEHRIWGATARILGHYLDLLATENGASA